VKPPIIRRFRLRLGRAGQLVRICEYGPACGERDCKEFGDSCWLPDGSEEFYCYKHMRDQGYCPGCGRFWAGVESFDFSRSVYCENCADQLREDDWDEDLYEWDDDPRADPWEAALSNCSSSDWGQTCGAAGSEECEFECRIRQDYYSSLMKGVTIDQS
jgi:hypothetical protein